MCAGVKP
jgi:uracil phosphoribosyltransferase